VGIAHHPRNNNRKEIRMPDYRRARVPGGTFFFTIVTFNRRPIFADPANVMRLREAIRAVRQERPFEIDAAVVLHDHMHHIWTLPADDSDYSWRIGRMKALFTKSLNAEGVVGSAHPTTSRHKHREACVWQRRFWEHVIRDERDYEHHVDYLHFNPVKHGLAPCPHGWDYSSFDLWCRRGVYEKSWCCSCGGGRIKRPYPHQMDLNVGE
jgi:putative transposase